MKLLNTVENSPKEVCSLHLISSKRGQENSTCGAVSFSVGQQEQKGTLTILNRYKYSLKQPCYHLCHEEVQFDMFPVQPYMDIMDQVVCQLQVLTRVFLLGELLRYFALPTLVHCFLAIFELIRLTHNIRFTKSCKCELYFIAA